MPKKKVPRIKPGIYHVLEQGQEKYPPRFYQLKAGHGAVGVFEG